MHLSTPILIPTKEATAEYTYTFDKWTSSNTSLVANKTTANTTFTMPASDIEITATFSTIPYTITYHNVQDVENNNPATYIVESNDITLSNLTKQGYNFLGWATSADGEPKQNITIQKTELNE